MLITMHVVSTKHMRVKLLHVALQDALHSRIAIYALMTTLRLLLETRKMAE